MKLTDFVQELKYPLSNMATFLAMLFFWLIFNVAKLLAVIMPAIGPIIALALLLLVSPAFFRYLLLLLETRANDRPAPVPTSEMFAVTGQLWSLTPLLVAGLLVWGEIWLSNYGVIWMLFYGLAILIVAPASLAILAITHSPIESLNPLAIARMFQACGLSYSAIPITVGVLAFLVVMLFSAGLPAFIIELGTCYLAFLVFTLTGGILNANDVALNVDIGSPRKPTEKEIAGDLEKAREKVASHAYGFISRGNREGGFAHIMDWIQKEPDIHEASAWFFNKMMKWESKDAALFYAQLYLAHLLHHDEDAKVLKLVSVCLHENPRWKPRAEDRHHVLALAEKYHRDDLLKSLRN